MRRRDFLRTAGGVAGTAAMGLSALSCWPGKDAPPVAGLGTGGYGPLRDAGSGLLLPEGFSFVEIGRAGTPMADGRATPPLHDGMCALPLPNGNIRLIRNHEVGPRPAGDAPSPRAYDPLAGGGTTSLEIDPEARTVIRDFTSLDGTIRNCAGGPTPWGSWLSCEETVFGAAEGLRDHGYVFEVPASLEEVVVPVPLKALGRFVHEAVAVDSATGVVYLTEDAGRAGFYRFTAARPYVAGQPADLVGGGRLEMLAVAGQAEYDTATGQRAGAPLDVEWVLIADPDPSRANATPSAVFDQGWNLGGARFARIEGTYHADGSIFFNCTSGGDAQAGQVWQYDPLTPERGRLTLLYESPSTDVLNHPDNMCVSPRGGLVLCEDGGGNQYVRGLTRQGTLFDLARNMRSESEWAGATFSPDGQTLFVNAQGNTSGVPGITFAIWGPWERGAL